MSEEVIVRGKPVPVNGARAETILRAGDVVELRVQQDSPFLSWFAPDPDEAAENVAQALSAEALTIRDERRPDVRGWVLAIESATGFEENDEVFVDVRLRVVEFDSRPPELVEPEELEAGLVFWQLAVLAGEALAIALAAGYFITQFNVTLDKTGLRASAFGFGFIDAIVVAAVAWVLVTWMRKGRASG